MEPHPCKHFSLPPSSRINVGGGNVREASKGFHFFCPPKPAPKNSHPSTLNLGEGGQRPQGFHFIVLLRSLGLRPECKDGDKPSVDEDDDDDDGGDGDDSGEDADEIDQWTETMVPECKDGDARTLHPKS